MAGITCVQARSRDIEIVVRIRMRDESTTATLRRFACHIRDKLMGVRWKLGMRSRWRMAITNDYAVIIL
jgi:hypothetical protein